MIVGRESNLSARLAAAAGDIVLVSARDVVARPELLSEAAGGERVALVLNSFRPSHLLRETAPFTTFVDQALRAITTALDAAPALELDRIAYTSTAALYGDSPLCDEADPPRAADLHASLKLVGERLVEAAGRARGIPTTAVRVFNMYGGVDRFSVVSKIIAAARDGTSLTVSNGGAAVRDFIHIDDVVRSYHALLAAPEPPTVLNIGTGRGVSVRALLDQLRDAGHPVAEEGVVREEIAVSVARTERLARLVDPGKFVRVEDHILQAVRG